MITDHNFLRQIFPNSAGQFANSVAHCGTISTYSN